MSGQYPGQLTYVYDLFRGMEDYSINQLYHGDFSTTITDNILSAVETCLSGTDNDIKLRKRIYFLSVESLQNITRHEEKIDPVHKGNCFFLLQGSGTIFYLTSGNYIANERVEALQARLEVVNSLDTESLRAYAKELMEAGDYSGRGGAGLGLIEMARKSGHKLQYSFVKFNDKVSYFYFQIKVNITDTSLTNLSPQDTATFNNAQLIHQVTYKNKLDFAYCGNFSAINSALLSTILKYSYQSVISDKADQSLSETVKVFTDNIIAHGNNDKHLPQSKRGMLILNREQGYLALTSGNYTVKNQKLIEMSKLFNINNTTDTNDKLNKLASLKPVYVAANGQLSFNLVTDDKLYDFVITKVKIGINN